MEQDRIAIGPDGQRPALELVGLLRGLDRAILQRFVEAGGSVVISSHVMTLVEQLCDHVGVIARGRLVAAGTLDQVRDGGSLDDAFVRLVGGRITVEGLSWLAS